MKSFLKKYKYLLSALAFVLWAIFFIRNSSFQTINGERYFCLFDDAMISMRYAWNFSHGNGLVFNAGERVEGYTNLLMVLVMSIFTGSLDEKSAVLGVQVLGIFTVLAIAWVTLAIARLVLDKKSEQNICFPVFALVLLYYPLAYWSLMGMETGLLSLLTLLAYWFMLRYAQGRETRDLFLSGLSLGLGGITRPDILLLGLPLAVYLLFIEQDRGWRQTLLAALIFGSSCLLVPLGQFVFRWLYYGELFPNTYYLKLTGLPLSSRLRMGLDFIITYLFETLPLWLLAISSLLFNFKKERLLMFSSIALLVAYQIWTGGDAWYYWRFMMPAIPLLFILGVEELWSAAPLVGKFFYSPVIQVYTDRNPVWMQVKSSQMVKKIAGALFLLAGLGLLSFSILPEMFGFGKSGFGLVQQAGFFFAIFLLFIGTLMGLTTPKEKEREIHRSFLLGLFIVYFLLNYRFLPQISFESKPFQVSSNRGNVNAGLALRELTDENASVGVFWGGALPYYSQRYTIDFLGKADEYIAHLAPDQTSRVSSMPGHNKYDLTYSIQQLKPTYAQGFVWGEQDLNEWKAGIYREVEYKGVKLNLLLDSPAVRWELLHP